MEQCPPLKPLEGRTAHDLMQKLIDVAGLYNECRAIHKTLVEWAEEPSGN